MKILVFVSLLILSKFVLAQNEVENKMFIPIIPGCENIQNPSKELTDCLGNKLSELIHQNLDKENLNRLLRNVGDKKAYTKFKFVITKEGKINNLSLVDETDMNLFLEIKKAILKINKNYNFQPASYNGEIINFSFNLPFRYTIK